MRQEYKGITLLKRQSLLEMNNEPMPTQQGKRNFHILWELLQRLQENYCPEFLFGGQKENKQKICQQAAYHKN